MRPIDADALRRNMRFTCSEIMAGTASYKAPLDEIDAAPTVPQWIPVTERLPDISKSVLICDIDGDIYLGYRTRYGDYYPAYGDDRIKCVTAWMPLPEPYKEGQDETD